MTDEARERMIDAKALEALAYAGADRELARAAVAQHAALVRGRSKETIERLEREKGLR